MSFQLRSFARRYTRIHTNYCLSRQSRAFPTLCLAVTSSFCSQASHAQGTPQQPSTTPGILKPIPNQTTVQQFHRLKWRPDTNTLSTQGPVDILYTAPNGEITTLQANDIYYDQMTGELTSKGDVVLQRNEGTFRGKDIKYNLNTKIGHITDASVESTFFRMRGKRIESFADGSYKMIDGDFTTCTASQPDYKIHVSSIKVSPAQYISARNVKFYLGRTALVPIPSLSRHLNTDHGLPIPYPGYSNSEGLTFRVQDSLIDEIDKTLDFDVRIGYRRLPTGFFAYQGDIGRPSLRARPPRTLLPSLGDPLSGFLEQINPPTYREYSESHYHESEQPRQTYYAILENQLFVYNRRRTDLNISRFPEVGVRLINMLGHTPPMTLRGMEHQDDQNPPLLSPAEAYRRRVPNAPALLNVNASLGEIIENPTKVSSGRLALRANLASQPLLLGKRLSLRAGITDWFNLYTRGTAYNLFSPEIELDYLPTRTSVFNIAYRYLADNGSTPFLFDRRDVRHELRLQYQVSGPWAFGIQTKFDLERSRAYDTQIAAVRNFDCMQVGLAFRTRGQSINLIFNLLPPIRDRAAHKMPLGTP